MSNVRMTKDQAKTDAGRPYGGESPGERVLRRRQQFLDAGLELFGTVGYRATTVRILCKQAKLTDRYFYESFTGTEDLLVEVYRKCMDELQGRVLQSIAGARPGADVRLLVQSGLDSFFAGVEDARVARVIWLEILGVSPRVDQMYTAGVRGFANLFLGLARSMHPRWHSDDEEGQILAIAVVGAVSQTTLAWLLSDYRASRQAMVAATSHVFMGVVASIEAAGQADG